MIRLMLLLGVGLYLTLMVLGQDNGQKRYGLMGVAEQPAQPEAAPTPSEAVVFIPAQTVMKPPVVAAPVVAEVAAPVAEPLPEPQVDGGRLLTVSARAANVRMGPGTTFDVVGSLTQGEQVLVVDDETPIEGWSRVRLEGDGVEGYVATRLLSDAE